MCDKDPSDDNINIYCFNTINPRQSYQENDWSKFCYIELKISLRAHVVMLYVISPELGQKALVV